MHGKLIHNLKRQRRAASPAAVLRSTDDEPLNLVKVSTPTTPASTTSNIDVNQPTKRFRSASLPEAAVPSSDFLTLALQKVFALQADLAAIDAEAASDAVNNGHQAADCDDVDSGNEEEDSGFLGMEAEALGFAICAREALTFLAANGEPRTSDLVQRLRARLVGKCEGLPI